MTHFSSTVRFAESVCTVSHHSSDSGHGGQTKDHDGDEADGSDEGKSSIFFFARLSITCLTSSYLSCKRILGTQIIAYG